MPTPVVFFSGLDSQSSNGLWVSDGTATGTIEIGGLANAGVSGAASRGLAPTSLDGLGAGVIFSGTAASGNSRDLWFSNGTAAGTLDISRPAGVAIANSSTSGLSPTILGNFGSNALFLGTDSAGSRGLWVTNGTAAGTTEIGGLQNAAITGANFAGVTSGSKFNAQNFASLPNGVIFTGDDSNGRLGLWVTDGTTAGTVEIGGLLNAGIPGADYGQIYDAISFNGKVLFDWGNASLWVTDGTASGTVKLASAYAANSVAAIGSKALFLGTDAGLDVTDGTLAGTAKLGGAASRGITGANQGALGLNPAQVTSLGNVAVFAGHDTPNNVGLWVTDGTASGTVELGGIANAGIPNAYSNGLHPVEITVLGSKAVFVGNDASGQQTLWVTDGTAAGTSEIGGLNNAGVTGAPSAGLAPTSMTVSGGLVYFQQTSKAGIHGLWVTDGTAAGTHEVTGIAGAQASGVAPNNIAGATIVTSSIGQLNTAFANVLFAAPTSALATTPTITLGDGSSVTNAIFTDAQMLPTLAAQVDSGQITLASALNTVEHFADASTSVALIAYQFFTGSTPSQAGYGFLVNGTTNPNDLDSAYYAQFNTQNRFINFSSNLGKVGAGQAAFAAAYGSLDLTATMTKAYTAIFGFAPAAGKIAAILGASVGPNETRADYFAFYGQDGANGQGTKAAAVGWLLTAAVQADLGAYAVAHDAFLDALANGSAQFASNLLTAYPNYTAAQAAATEALLVGGGQSLSAIASPLPVSDTSANVAANLDALQALAAAGELSTVKLTDASPTLKITALQAAADTTLLTAISGAFAVVVTGPTAQINGASIPHFTTSGSQLDVTDLSFSALTATFNENAGGTSGQLHLSDGVHTATVTLVGQLASNGFNGSAAAAGFTLASDGHGGTAIGWI